MFFRALLVVLLQICLFYLSARAFGPAKSKHFSILRNLRIFNILGILIFETRHFGISTFADSVRERAQEMSGALALGFRLNP